MIDKNKIAKAARKCLAAFRKANPDGYSSSIIDIESNCLKNFKDGAKWAINEFQMDLWHDVFEEHIPCNKKVIVEYTYEGGMHYKSIKIPDDIHWVKGFSNEKRLRRWLYVDDLFPKEGDE